MNLLGDNIGTVNKNTETLIDASKEVGLKVNVERTAYMLVIHDQNAEKINWDIKIGNRSFEKVSQRGSSINAKKTFSFLMDKHHISLILCL
jgi:hypothetical protein